jgi:FkbM family methyltransferase
MSFSLFRRKVPTYLHDTGQCRMHVRVNPQDLNIDVAICHEVQVQDCYRVQELAASGFKPEIIVDIGAHIGSFSALATKYFPGASIYAFEPLAPHYELLLRNAPRHRSRLKNLAVLGFYGHEDGHDIYAGNEFERAYRSKQLSNAISATQLFQKFKLPRIDFLKIDCEQGEVNIFRELDFIDRLKDIAVISGEWHFDTAKRELQTIVGKTHDVDVVDVGMWNHFFAKRKAH